MHRNDELAMLRTLLSAMAKRAGGMVAFSAEELEEADSGQVFYDREIDRAGFTHLHLLPDYVHIGEGEEEKDDYKEMQEMLDRLGPAIPSSAPTITGTWNNDWSYTPLVGTPVTSGTSTVGTVTGGGVGSAGPEFVMKLSAKGQNVADRWKAMSSTMYSIGWDPAGKIKEISLMADTPKMPEQPAPPEGGGLSTTDPTFANQGGQAPKENKPAKKSDVKKVR